MPNYTKSIVSTESTITQAVEAINCSGIRLAVVVDGDNHLKGVVTDGDVRRALLSYVDFTLPVTNIMNANPVVVAAGSTASEMVTLMREHGILQLPVVDQNNKLVDIETFERIVDAKTQKSTPVFLMAGGFGTRLRPLTNSIPKVMLKVGSRPILETIMLGFIEHGFNQFYISVYYLAEQIREHFGDGSRWGVKIEYIEEREPLGTGGALSLLPTSIDEPIIMMNGDLLTNIDFSALLKFHKSRAAKATMCVREYCVEVPYGVIESKDSNITSIVEKPKQQYFVNAGVYVLSPEVFKAIPKNKHVDMPNLFNELIKSSEKVIAYPLQDYWLDIGRLGDFEKAQADVLDIFSRH